jgi:hypothetical protein
MASKKKHTEIMGRLAQVVCPGCNRVMSTSMDHRAVFCTLKSCEHYGVYFKAPQVALVPLKEG